MSDLIDRYLMAVSANLPKRDRDDITAELRDVLFSKVEAREEQLGHPLSKAEEQALLKAFGHPLEVAGRYNKDQFLIGPSVYPFYVFYLKATLGIIAVIYIALYAVFVIGGGYPKGPDRDIVTAMLIAYAIVTLVFLAIERSGAAAKMAAKWTPAQLPMMGAPNGRKATEVLFEMAMGVVVILWWTGAIHFPDAAPGHWDLKLAPIWTSLFWPLLALMVIQVGLDLFELVMPGMVRAHAVARVVFHVALAVVVAVLWQAGHWIDITITGGRPGLQETVTANFDSGFKIGLAFTILVVIYETWRAARRLSRFNKMQHFGLA